MNVFVLDRDPTIAAQSQCDKHVVKMPLETAQLLCTTHHVLGNHDSSLYKPTHANHPCTIWARASRANYLWLFKHFEALNDEYFFRYYKNHLSWRKLRDILCEPPSGLHGDELTPFAQAMPDEYKHADAVEAYRAYYINDKAPLLKYTKRVKPNWLTC